MYTYSAQIHNTQTNNVHTYSAYIQCTQNTVCTHTHSVCMHTLKPPTNLCRKYWSLFSDHSQPTFSLINQQIGQSNFPVANTEVTVVHQSVHMSTFAWDHRTQQRHLDFKLCRPREKFIHITASDPALHNQNKCPVHSWSMSIFCLSTEEVHLQFTLENKPNCHICPTMKSVFCWPTESILSLTHSIHYHELWFDEAPKQKICTNKTSPREVCVAARQKGGEVVSCVAPWSIWLRWWWLEWWVQCQTAWCGSV